MFSEYNSVEHLVKMRPDQSVLFDRLILLVLIMIFLDWLWPQLRSISVTCVSAGDKISICRGLLHRGDCLIGGLFYFVKFDTAEHVLEINISARHHCSVLRYQPVSDISIVNQATFLRILKTLKTLLGQ